jgi:hypothetical protein
MRMRAAKINALGLAGLITALFAYPALAHHSFAMFDNSRMEVLSGTVTELEWRNPHCWLHLAVADDAGNELTWSFEMGSISQLVRDGWAEDSVAAGDAIEIRFHPLKDGSNGGQLRFVKRPDGETMCQGNHCAELEDAG